MMLQCCSHPSSAQGQLPQPALKDCGRCPVRWNQTHRTRPYRPPSCRGALHCDQRAAAFSASLPKPQCASALHRAPASALIVTYVPMNDCHLRASCAHEANMLASKELAMFLLQHYRTTPHHPSKSWRRRETGSSRQQEHVHVARMRNREQNS